jgi:hypothetical protein
VKQVTRAELQRKLNMSLAQSQSLLVDNQRLKASCASFEAKYNEAHEDKRWLKSLVQELSATLARRAAL